MRRRHGLVTRRRLAEDMISPLRRHKGKEDGEEDCELHAEDVDGFGEDATASDSAEPETEERIVICCLFGIVSTVVVEPASFIHRQRIFSLRYRVGCILVGDNDEGTSSRKGKQQVPVLMPSVRLPSPPHEQYPFPVTAASSDDNDDYQFTLNSEAMEEERRAEVSREF
ncbi:hypothetical protein D9613_012751 [Agrocybe pediades]|uniref:Uncharacterized protein n=1 Tax=Agrocybe pediades TaxID=84607 RepID=A0A8H4QKL0_9AGAR|nr:hypothetical protein D9613_012751 [Agrocybe pediades]